MLIRYIGRRLLTIIPILLITTIGVFAMQALLPGDLAATLAGPDATRAQVDSIRQTLDLNQPFVERYWTWLTHALQGNLGTSFITHATVTSTIASAWAVTASLVIGALVVSVIVSPILAAAAANRPGGWFDRLTTVGSSTAVAIPDFVLGMLLLVVFGVVWRVFPIGSYVSPSDSIGQWLDHLVLPVVCLAVPVAAGLTRQLRYGLADVLEQDYIRTAYAKGLRNIAVLGKHALPAAAPPAVALVGIYTARLLGGAVIVEEVFGLPGLGQVTVQAILNKDFAVIQGVVLLFVAIALLANLAADVVTLILRPRLLTAAILEDA